MARPSSSRRQSLHIPHMLQKLSSRIFPFTFLTLQHSEARNLSSTRSTSCTHVDSAWESSSSGSVRQRRRIYRQQCKSDWAWVLKGFSLEKHKTNAITLSNFCIEHEWYHKMLHASNLLCNILVADAVLERCIEPTRKGKRVEKHQCQRPYQ